MEKDLIFWLTLPSAHQYLTTWVQLRAGGRLMLEKERMISTMIKMAIYCPQGSGTLRQQLLMMHGIALYCMVLHVIV